MIGTLLIFIVRTTSTSSKINLSLSYGQTIVNFVYSLHSEEEDFDGVPKQCTKFPCYLGGSSLSGY